MFVDFLEKHPDNSYTAKQIHAALGAEKISLSAVYRNLAELEHVGSVRKRGIYYEYTGSKMCKACLHMSCTQCGRSFHLSGVFSEFIVNNILSSEKFAVDRNDTVFYGLCNACR